jgi:hypothetical protein
MFYTVTPGNATLWRRYERKANAEKGIQAVKKAADAAIVDLTEEAAKK